MKKMNMNKKTVTMIIAAVCAVVLVVAGVGGWLAWSRQRRELNTAKASCASASDSLRTKANAYDALVNGDAKAASGITTEQVKDATTVESLAKELKEEPPAYEGCVAGDKDGLDAATAKLNTQATWYETHRASLGKAVEQVNASKLDKVIDNANALLNDSDGKVQDNAVRDELSKAIEAKDEQQIADATAKVNDSIASKTRADEEARAQAEAEAAAQAAAEAAAAQAAAAQSYNYGYTNSGYSNSGYSSGTTSGSGSSSASTGSGSSGGSSSSGSSNGPRSVGYGVEPDGSWHEGNLIQR